MGIALACAALAARLPAAPAPTAPVFRAGAATANITPPLGLPVIGGFVPFPATHVHDELHARCMVLDDGKTQLAFVVCDVLGVATGVSAEARAFIEKECGLPPSRVMISATHTHSACSAIQVGAELDDYQKFVARRVADVVQRARNTLRPARIAFARAEAPEHVNNRRWSMKPGKMPPNPFGGIDQAKMNPPAGSPDLGEPAGPTDPVISILSVREPDGRPIAVFASYSLHYVGGVGPGHVSADYYGYVCRDLEKLMKAEDQDPPFVAIMANGTSGDINNVNFRTPRPKREPYEQIRAVAADVAAKVCAAVEKAEYRDHVTLDARYREPVIARRATPPEMIAWAKKTIEERSATAPKGDLPLIYAQRVLKLSEAPAEAPVPLQVLRIGDVGLATMPCEVLCEIGLEFKQRCPLQPAFLVSLTHGYMGYLPPPRQHALGGYETWPGTNRLEPDASVKMVAALLEMAAEMKPGPAE